MKHLQGENSAWFRNILAAFIALAVLLPVHSVSASGVLQGVREAAQGETATGTERVLLFRTDSVPEVIGTLLGGGLFFIGGAFLLLSIYGGTLWMTSTGNAEQYKQGFKTLIFGALGVAVMTSSVGISSFILSLNTSYTLPAQQSTSTNVAPPTTIQVSGACSTKSALQTPCGNLLDPTSCTANSACIWNDSAATPFCLVNPSYCLNRLFAECGIDGSASVILYCRWDT